VTVLEVRTDDLRTTRFTEHAPTVPADGEIVARVRHFGLSANNITYGLLGEMVGYWRVFPAEPGWGRLPMWGVAEVVASAHPEITEGELLFGYVPMATHVMLTPGKVRDGGFADVSAHRQALAPAYNNYRRLDADPLYDPDHPGDLPLFLPLFALSFLLDAYLTDQARTVVLSSASSKTSLGLARLLAARGVEVVGLTSPRNAPFVTDLGIGTTLTYDQITDLPATETVFVDVAGNAAVRAAVHEHLRDRLVRSVLVGATHGSVQPGPELPGPEPTWFFTPDHMRDRIREWGPAEFDRRFGAALREFAAWTRSWLTITTATGQEQVRATYLSVLDGSADPAIGHLLTVG
jgi:NADPH:quinone reductase-like Zn-dependent oxidoreductase